MKAVGQRRIVLTAVPLTINEHVPRVVLSAGFRAASTCSMSTQPCVQSSTTMMRVSLSARTHNISAKIFQVLCFMFCCSRRACRLAFLQGGKRRQGFVADNRATNIPGSAMPSKAWKAADHSSCLVSVCMENYNAVARGCQRGGEEEEDEMVRRSNSVAMGTEKQEAAYRRFRTMASHTMDASLLDWRNDFLRQRAAHKRWREGRNTMQRPPGLTRKLPPLSSASWSL